MTRKGIVQRNLQRFFLFSKFKKIRSKFKNKIYNKKLPINERFYYQNLVSSLPRNSSKTRIRNRCMITGRGRGMYRIFMMSRICIRKFASFSQLPGVKKSSW